MSAQADQKPAAKAAPAPSLRAEAEAFVAQECFHRKLTIPATADHGELTFSYSDIGTTSDQQPGQNDVPVILFIPGLFASRYIGVSLHPIAKALGIRVLIVDRPGFGSSTPVAVDKRLEVWLELVPQLLRQLNISHVTLISHCAGTVYALNTLYNCRDILSPERPMAVLLAPWVDPKHSKVTMMQAAQYIPSAAYSLFNGISRFAAKGMMITVSSSQAVLSNFGLGGPSEEQEQVAKSWAQKNAIAIEELCGLSTKMQGALQEQTLRRIFSESTGGSSDEARHCARKASQNSWGRADDYQVFARDIAELERSRLNGSDAAGRTKLKVRGFFATSDIIIGEGGRKYATKCWAGADGEFDDAFDFKGNTIQGSDHDGLVVSVDVWKEIVAEIRGASAE